MNATTVFPAVVTDAAGVNSDRSRSRRGVAFRGRRREAAVEALHESEPRTSVDGDVSSIPSAARQRSCSAVHPHIERHGS
jgi:hypothetical protein